MTMQIEVELQDISLVRKKLRVEIPAELAGREYEKVLRNYRQHARIPGFRPGRAPLEIVKRRFQSDIRGDFLQRLIPDSYRQALEEKGLAPLGEPDLENVDFKEGGPLCFEALFEVAPEFELPSYRGLQIRVPEKTVTDDMVEEQLERLRKENARLIPVEDRPVEHGDVVLIDLKGEYMVEEGARAAKPFHDESLQVEVGGERTHAAFTENLQGLNIGEETTFVVAYPEDYAEKKLAGRRVRFTVEVTDIRRKELPELNEEFARDLGDYEGLSDLRAKIREKLEEHLDHNRRREIRSQLVEGLLRQVDFEVPQVLVQDRIDSRIRDIAHDMVSRGVDPTQADVDWSRIRGELEPEAQREVRASMILDEIAAAEQIEATPEEIDREIDVIARSIQEPLEKVRRTLEREQRLEGIRTRIRRSKAVDIVEESAEIRAE